MERVPTSRFLRDLLNGAPSGKVPVGWLLDRMEERSFGVLMLLLGVLALVPGISGAVGVLVAMPAVQMMLARKAPVLPAFVSRREVSTLKLGKLIARLEPVLRGLERVIRPRWRTPIEATKRIVGVTLLLLGVLLLVPIPLSNVAPALIIILVAFAYLEDDGLLLCIALIAALLGLAAAAGMMWGTIKGIDFIDPKSP